MAIYTVVIAARLAGVRLRHGDVPGRPARHRQRDHEGGADRRRHHRPRLYRRIIIPLLRPVFLSAFVVLAHLAIKSYDLVIALTGGGPGSATELPATFMYSYTFTRNQMAVGAARAVIMLMMICVDHRSLPLFRAAGREAMTAHVSTSEDRSTTSSPVSG